MKVLITGAAGMLGTDLSRELANDFEIAGAGLAPSSASNYTQTDLTVRENVASLFLKFKPDVVFHTAAMTDVDACETRREEALRVNFEMTKYLADEANRAGARLIFFSTDYVFPGDQAGELDEDSGRNPLNFYGETKFLAEKYIEQHSDKYVIFRITWLYGIHGKSFPRTILERAKIQRKFDVVHDQVGRPTYTRDVAGAMKQLLLKKVFEKKGNAVYHLGNQNSASWAEFAEFILKQAGCLDAEVNRTTAKILSRPAKRPANSVLSLEKIKLQLGLELRPWKQAVSDFIREFQEQGVTA